MKINIRKSIEVLSHLFFWLITAYFFTHNSFLRPLCVGALYKEILCVLFICIVVYFNYFLIIPQFFLHKRYILFFLLALLSIFACSISELLLVKSNIIDCYQGLSPALISKFLKTNFYLIFLRNTAFVLFFMLLKLYQHSKNSLLLERQIALIEKEKNMIEKEFLSTKISPYFLLNIITSVQAKAIEKDDDLPEYLSRLAEVLSYYTTHATKERVLFRDEIVFYENYLNLEILRHHNNLIFSYIINEIPEEVYIAPLLFAPIIEEAFRYVDKNGSGHIKFEFTFTKPNLISFECITSSASFPNTVLQLNSNLIKLKKRLVLLYPEHHRLDMQKEGNYCIFRLSLNINYNGK